MISLFHNHKKNCKAQIMGQVFIFLLGILLATLILLYGYRAISGFIGGTQRISLVKFKTNLESAVRTISTQYGDVDKLELNLPSTYQKVCFVQTGYAGLSTGLCSNTHQDYDPIICDVWTTPGNDQNVFLIPMAESPIKVLPLEIDGGYICVSSIQGRVTIRLQGLGNRTKVSKWV